MNVFTYLFLAIAVIAAATMYEKRIHQECILKASTTHTVAEAKELCK